MTQSEDNTSANVWTSNFGLWNNPMNDNNVGDIWNGSASVVPGNALPFQKINGLGKEADKSTEGVKLPDSVDILASWSPMNSIFQDVDKNSIWSSSNLYSSDEKNPSLSTSSLLWSSTAQEVNNDLAESKTTNELWDLSRNTLFFGIPELDHPETWKFEQLTGTEGVQAAVTSASVIAENSVDGPASASRSDSTGSDNSSTKNAGLHEEPSKSAYSAEQLCGHLINSHEGWGKRPVDQSTPWDASELARPGSDQLNRSGITTPTPGSCSTSTLVGNIRVAPQMQRLESNVWTSEPPTGTGIWEMHYETTRGRSSLWPASANLNSIGATPSTQPNPMLLVNNMRSVQQNGVVFPRTGAYRNWEINDKVWNNSGPTTSGAASRSVVGTRSGNISNHNAVDESSWNSDGSFCMFPNPSGLDVSGNCGSWDVSGNTAAIQWNSAISTGSSNFSVPPFGPTNSDDLHRQISMSACNASNNDRLLVHPFSNTYRADLVKYLMSQGFKKEDVQTALIDSNMEPERALHELRERYNSSRPIGVMKSNFHGTGGNLPQFSGNSTFPGSVINNGNNNGVPLSSSNTFSRNKLLGPNTTNGGAQLMSLSPHPNPQLIRQQLTQQVRSALNLSVPNPLTGPLGNTGNGGVSAGNSLLGQPPPPLLTASNLLTAHASGINQPITNNTNNSFTSGHSRTGGNHNVFPNNIPMSNLHNGGPNVQSKRIARQAAIYSAIQELQKKRHSIQQQVYMYKKNPAMNAQPQCADVFVELQGQLQQIDAQIRAKMAQLNLASAQDSTTSVIRGQSTNPIDGLSVSNQTRVSQDQFVQQLMEMHIKPGRLGSPEIADTEFPTIGTWTPHTKASNDVQEAMGPKSLAGSRSTAGVIESPNNSNNGSHNWTAGWMPNGNISNASMTNLRSGLGNISNWQSGPRAFPPTLDGAVPGAKGEHTQQQSSQPQQPGAQSAGQWLLIHTASGHQSNMDLNNLHMLLSQFGLTNFHLLNTLTGLVLVRIQSTELSLRLICNLADRLTIEAISEPEALAHLQQLNVRLRSENCTSGQFSPLAEISGLATGTAPSGSKWITSDPPSASGFNTVPINSRKPNNHNARLGVMVSGIH